MHCENHLSAEKAFIRCLDEEITVGIVYLDFAKAFTSANNRLHLTKFKCYEWSPFSNDSPSEPVSRASYRKRPRLHVEFLKAQYKFKTSGCTTKLLDR